MYFSWIQPASAQSPVPPPSTDSGHASFALIGSSACEEGHLCSPFFLGRALFDVLQKDFQ